ncbi:RES domain-containing protein [Cryobacterium cheniae]|uniref:RES domain-containing protein n=1 Tax=Cryobacterium cheniae TaxID=1259262 RepID=A0A4R8XQT4_9MICO|nr:RES domain-containing protein [Cryobacterium cheniae]TFC80789.1 RES domain-containing protein [Cryobacterium cheniae]
MDNTPDRADRMAVRPDPGEVWRIGYGPAPWNWVDWAHAINGRFNGRWDSLDSAYRTIYAGSSLFACLVEVLARFRPDPILETDMGGIRVDEADASLYASVPVGTVDESWLSVRQASRANLSGRYCDVADSATIAALRPTFGALAVGFGLADFDSSALQNSEPRELTQRVGREIYEMSNDDGQPLFDGVRFLSRHGNDLELWTIFERSTDGAFSAQLSNIVVGDLRPGNPDVEAAMRLHGLSWG